MTLILLTVTYVKCCPSALKLSIGYLSPGEGRVMVIRFEWLRCDVYVTGT